MKVTDLIEILKDCDPNAEVVCPRMEQCLEVEFVDYYTPDVTDYENKVVIE